MWYNYNEDMSTSTRKGKKTPQQIQQEKDNRPPRVVIIATVMDKIAQGLVGPDLHEFIGETYKVNKRTANGYISEAKARLVEVGADFAQSQIAELLFKLRDLYEIALNDEDIDTCLEILRHQAALTGLSLKDPSQNIMMLSNQMLLGAEGPIDKSLQAGDAMVTTIAGLVSGDKKTRLAFLRQIQREVPQLPAVIKGNGGEPKVIDLDSNDD